MTGKKSCKPLNRTYAYKLLRLTPELKTEMPKFMDEQRIQNATRGICEPWFQMVDRLEFSQNIPERYNINIDETPFGGNVNISSPTKVFLSTDIAERPVLPCIPRHINFTVTLAVSLDGSDYPTQLIWKATTVPEEFQQLNPTKIRVYINDSGYQDTDTFLRYMTTDVLAPIMTMREACNDAKIPIVVFLDGHTSRYGAEFKSFCASHNILAIIYPSHTSHALQVLDQNINSTLKELYSGYLHELESYEYEEQTIIPYGTPNLESLSKEGRHRQKFVWSITKALQDTLTAKNIRNAWKPAGPFSKQSTTQKLAAPPTESSLPFSKDNYILVQSARISTRGERRKQKYEFTGRKPRA